MEKIYTPIINQYIKIKEKHKDKILFFRMGDFYELFFDDAIECSKLLLLNLTSRNKKDTNPIPMCGFPYYVSNHYISKLMTYNKKVAICEQVGGDTNARIMRREITSVITPGTFVAEDKTENINNYITCIYLEDTYGISNLDICSGYFSTKQLSKKEDLEDELDKIKPTEILISDNIENIDEIKSKLIQKIPLDFFNYTDSIKILKTILPENIIKSPHFLQFKNAIISAGFLLKYIYTNQNKKLKNINNIDIHDDSNILKIDKQTRKNLELFISNTGDKENSLFHVIDSTCTIMGKRLLKKWFDTPMISTNNIIKDRLNTISYLKKNYYQLEIIRQYLNEIDDIEKIIYNISKFTIKIIDLNKLKHSLINIIKIKKIIKILKKTKLLKDIYSKIDSFEYIIKLIDTSLNNNKSFLQDNEYIKTGFDKKVDLYRKKIKTIDSFILKYQIRERKRTNIKSLKIIQSKEGYCIEIGKKHTVPEDYIEIKKLSNTTRYLNSKIKKIEYIFFKIKNNLVKREKKLYNYICYKIKKNMIKIQCACRAISTLDVLQSLAKISSLYSWVKPKITKNKIIKIKDGRHPVVEIKNKLLFTPNNTKLDKNKLIYIITGANMSGKSTYMRQVAIITFLAHIGSHVPAKYAKIGGVDKIFTRLGANDDIANAFSTFMLEMKEMAQIINNATKNSLIIIDEVGRGTNYIEGKSIALSFLSYFIIEIRAFLLFSTHFHDISSMSKLYTHVNRIYFKTILENNKLKFIYKYNKGYTDKGFALYVAKNAGIPPKIINMCAYYLIKLKQAKHKQIALAKAYSTLKKYKIILLQKLKYIANISKIFIK